MIGHTWSAYAWLYVCIESGRHVTVVIVLVHTLVLLTCNQYQQYHVDIGLQIMFVKLELLEEPCACTFLDTKWHGDKQRLWLLHRVALLPPIRDLPSRPCTHKAGTCLAGLEPCASSCTLKLRSPFTQGSCHQSRKESITSCTHSMKVVEIEYSRRLCRCRRVGPFSICV